MKDGIMETSKSIQWVMEAFTPSPLSLIIKTMAKGVLITGVYDEIK
jgi:hypothetical protein